MSGLFTAMADQNNAAGQIRAVAGKWSKEDWHCKFSNELVSVGASAYHSVKDLFVPVEARAAEDCI